MATPRVWPNVGLILILAGGCAEPARRRAEPPRPTETRMADARDEGREDEAKQAPSEPAPQALSAVADAAGPLERAQEAGEVRPTEVGGDARAADGAPELPVIYSVGMTTWILKRPVVKEGDFLGYVRVGFPIPLRSRETVVGQGCPGRFYQVAPHGYVCQDRTVSETPRKGFLDAALATRPIEGPFPYRYAISETAPMYNRIPTSAEQKRYERWLPKRGPNHRLPKTLRSHEELATDDVIAPSDHVPEFLKNGASPKEAPYDLVEQTLPLGAMISFTRAFEAEGRVWLLSTDHTLVPADRVRPFAPSRFRGIPLGPVGREFVEGDRSGAEPEVALPIAWIRERARPRYAMVGGAAEARGEFGLRTWVALTGAELTVGDTRYLETKEKDGEAPLYIAEKDATRVDPNVGLPLGVKAGQKWFEVRLTKGTLVAYEGERPVYATLVSPGRGGVPVKGSDPVLYSTTPLGSYGVTFKDRAATMSPETGKNRSFWIQDVPHTLYFNPPFALHAAFWHERFGEYVSAGCVNVSPLDAELLFHWAGPAVPAGWQGATGAGAIQNGETTIVVVRR